MGWLAPELLGPVFDAGLFRELVDLGGWRDRGGLGRIRRSGGVRGGTDGERDGALILPAEVRRKPWVSLLSAARGRGRL